MMLKLNRLLLTSKLHSQFLLVCLTQPQLDHNPNPYPWLLDTCRDDIGYAHAYGEGHNSKLM